MEIKCRKYNLVISLLVPITYKKCNLTSNVGYIWKLFTQTKENCAFSEIFVWWENESVKTNKSPNYTYVTVLIMWKGSRYVQ